MGRLLLLSGREACAILAQHGFTEVRRVIYTTNAIESLSSVINKATRQRKVFPTDGSAMKAVHLAIQSAAKKWTILIRNWEPSTR